MLSKVEDVRVVNKEAFRLLDIVEEAVLNAKGEESSEGSTVRMTNN